MNREAVYRALSKVAWGYLLLYVNFNLGTLNLLPAWAGYLLLWQAIDLLEGELRSLSLLRPFCLLLGVWQGAVWGCAIFGLELSGRLFLWDLVAAVVRIYFHFQLLTDLAGLAGRTPSEDAQSLGRSLRICRNLDAVLITLLFALPLWQTQAEVLAFLLAVAGLIVALATLCSLFRLRKYFRDGPEAPPSAP